MDYKESGVDIEAGKSFVEKIKPYILDSQAFPGYEYGEVTRKVVGGYGGFSGMMPLPPVDSKYAFKKPVMVAGTDGVGTKLRLVQSTDDPQLHKWVGGDLVAMCVNDVITSGAYPLFFMDYIATAKIDPEMLLHVVKGMNSAVKAGGMVILGGETAEMPGMYEEGVYDLAGFCVGLVDQDDVVDGSKVKVGDQIIGIESNGLHSNGFSLINKLWSQGILHDIDLFELLQPTKIYAHCVNALLYGTDPQREEYKGLAHIRDPIAAPIHAMAHITGGGIPENLPRCLPKGYTANVDYDSWPRPDIFQKIAKDGDVSEEEMRNVFNLGIGYCLVVPPEAVEKVLKVITGRYGWRCGVIGEVERKEIKTQYWMENPYPVD